MVHDALVGACPEVQGTLEEHDFSATTLDDGGPKGAAFDFTQACDDPFYGLIGGSPPGIHYLPGPLTHGEALLWRIEQA